MIKIIKNFFIKIIFLVLVMGIILPNILNLIINVCADGRTITQLIWLEPMPGSINIEYDVIAEEEIYEEITYETNFYDTTHQSESNWHLLNKYDLLPYNEIHKRVQNDPKEVRKMKAKGGHTMAESALDGKSRNNKKQSCSRHKCGNDK